MRIVKISKFCAKLRALENREKLPKIIELRGFGKIDHFWSFLAIFKLSHVKFP